MTKLKLVPPEQPAPVDIAQQWRDEVRQRDWSAVHIEGDRNPPISIARRVWAYTMPVSRRKT